jgi:hypothetical protein
VQLCDQHEKFVHSYAVLPVAAKVYARHSTVKPATGANTEEERIRRATRWLRDFAGGFERVGGADLTLRGLSSKEQKQLLTFLNSL